jgi:SIR2-like domain
MSSMQIIHQLLANIPSILRSCGYAPHYQLIVTTNYDDLLERAFKAAVEPFDLLTYVG